MQLWGANNDSCVLRFSFWKHPHLVFFVWVPKPWASSLPASVDSMVPKIILACGCCCLLLFPALCPLHCSGSSGWWAIPIPHPAEGSCDGNLGTELWCSPRGVQWTLAVGGAGKGQLIMKCKMVLPPWICSLGCAVSFMNWKWKGENVECSVNLACELLVRLENFLPLSWRVRLWNFVWS